MTCGNPSIEYDGEKDKYIVNKRGFYNIDGIEYELSPGEYSDDDLAGEINSGFVGIDDTVVKTENYQIFKPIKKVKTNPPKCTCDSRSLFHYGCKCSYAKWKKENKCN